MYALYFAFFYWGDTIRMVSLIQFRSIVDYLEYERHEVFTRAEY